MSTAAVTGGTAISAYAGVFGLWSGDLSFGARIDARLPFDSLLLAGFALLCFVALPMSLAAVSALRADRLAPDLALGSGVLLVSWIGVELAYIRIYSWFHPTYLAVAVVVLTLGWGLGRLNGSATEFGLPSPTAGGPLTGRTA